MMVWIPGPLTDPTLAVLGVISSASLIVHRIGLGLAKAKKLKNPRA